MTNTRDNILNNLRKNQLNSQKWADNTSNQFLKTKTKDTTQTLINNLESTHTKVYELSKSKLVDWFNIELAKLAVNNILVGKDFFAHLGLDENLVHANIHKYNQNIKTYKDELFNNIEAGITTTVAAISSSGSLVIWPTKDEPRSLSLVPPIHIAIVFKDQIFETFNQVIKKQQWVKNMPSNIVLVSGPSKTADIEQVLAYGVHGPKKLITLIIS